MAIQREQLEDQDDTLAQRSLEQESMRQRDSGPVPRKDVEEPLFGYDYITVEHLPIPRTKLDPRKAAGAGGNTADSRLPSARKEEDSLSRQGLFGVRGLTRALLDASVRAYFKYASPCQPILHVEVFSARYTLFFNLFEEYQGLPPNSVLPEPGSDNRPLSVLLILAVGCVGAALLEPPIAEKGSRAKFRLQDRMALRFREVLQEVDLLTRLRYEGTDVIEACYIMSDPSLKILGDDDPSNSSLHAIDWEKVMRTPLASQALHDPLRVSPSSAEAVVRLIFKLSINRQPRPRKDCPPGDKRTWISSSGAFIGEREVFRRIRIFWSAFMQDSFRSLGIRTPLQIGDDDYDLDLPRIVPRTDGFFTALIFQKHQPAASAEDKRSPLDGYSPYNQPRDDSGVGADPEPAAFHTQPARFVRFDALHLEVMLRLAFIIRSVSIRFVSQRSQGRGVLYSDIERAVASLQAWWNQLPADVTWGLQSYPLLRAKNDGTSIDEKKFAIPLRNSIKALFLETLYHANVLAICGAVRDYGIRFEVDLTEAVHLLAAQIGIMGSNNEMPVTQERGRTTLDMLQQTADAENKNGKESAEERKQVAKAKLDQLILKSFIRASFLARQAGDIGIVRASRSVFLNVFSAFAAYGCEFAKAAASMKSETAPFPLKPGQSPSDFVFARVQDYLYAMDTIDSYENISDMTNQLRTVLEESRKVCDKIRGRHDAAGGKSGSSDKDTPQSQGPAGSSESPAGTSTSGRTQDSSSSPPSMTGNSGLSWTSSNSGQTIPFRFPLRGDLPPGAPSVLSHMDVDEVTLLARAAMPNAADGKHDYAIDPFDKKMGTGAGWPQSFDTAAPASGPAASSSTANAPAHDAASLYGPGLDLNLENITGMDTQWLWQYLHGSSSNSHGPPESRGGSSGLPDDAAAYPPPLPQPSVLAAVNISHDRMSDAPANIALEGFGDGYPLGTGAGTVDTGNLAHPTVHIQQADLKPCAQHSFSTRNEQLAFVPQQQQPWMASPDSHLAQGSAGASAGMPPRREGFGNSPESVMAGNNTSSGVPIIEAGWDSFMKGAGDAQLWAESQWQGLTFPQDTQERH